MGDDGKTFPFTRTTEGSAQFTLAAGEEYKFCWALIVSKELRKMGMGVFMEEINGVTAEGSERLLHAGMPVLQPMDAPTHQMGAANQLGEGYFYTGQLDLRRLEFNSDTS